MKSKFFKIKILLWIILLFQNLSLIGKETSHDEQVRYYVAKENIVISEDGFWILDGASVVVVNNIFHDENGFYFLDTDESGWICNWCGAINRLDAVRCYRCKEPYGSRPPKKRNERAPTQPTARAWAPQDVMANEILEK